MPELLSKLCIVEHGKPRLSKAGREDSDCSPVASQTDLSQTLKRFKLNGVGRRGRRERLERHLARWRGEQSAQRTSGVLVDPVSVESPRDGPDSLERIAHAGIRARIPVTVDAQVPLNARVQ